ncbi:MAG: S8 family serine peptidase [Bryobacteraceae bacterium]|nr:S8 family serine peptidase [Bryobacteraceae bacterium]
MSKLGTWFTLIFLTSSGWLLLAQQNASNNDEEIPVIIGFRSAPGPGEEAAVRALGGKVKHRHTLVPAISGKLSKKAIEALKKNPAITAIEPDLDVYALDEYGAVWGVSQIGAPALHSGGNTGAGIKVCVIDSGIDVNHPDLSANYKGGYDYVNNDTDPADDNVHGTHVAGTVAAVLNGSGVVGVAPSAEIYAYKVLGASGSGKFSDVIKAVEACAALPGTKITNNSYGSSSDPGTLVRQAFDNAYAAGVLHVAAAGNSGRANGAGDNVGYPAKYSSVIAVAATNSSNVRASWSSTGPAVELSAPGVSIYSTYPDDTYATLSGTSMASPHVAGAAALVFGCLTSDLNGDGVVNNDDVRLRMQQTAQDLGAAGRDNLYGFGLVRPDLACGTVSSTPPNAPSNLQATDVTKTSISLAWTDNSDNETGFELQRCTNTCVTLSLPANTASYTDTGLKRNTTYSYQVRAVNSAGASAWSNSITVKTAK